MKHPSGEHLVLASRTMSERVYCLTGVAVRYPGSGPLAPYVVKDFSLTVNRGEQLALIGPSGAGKTTLLAVLALAREPAEGSVELFGQNVWALASGERHDLRKRAKRLRYLLEFVAALFPARPVAAFLAALAEAQEAIGAYNDMVTAGDLLRGLDARDPAVSYAAGWVASQRLERLRDCERPLRRLLKAPRPWVAGR
jgi:ABC-type glutathione transport system ATPase component